MAKTWDKEIDINTDWNGDDSTGGLPVKGSRVQEFIRNQIRSMTSSLGGKFGKVAYEGGVIRFYDEDGGKELDSITITGTSYVITVLSDKSSNFNILSDDTEAKITFTPSTKAIEMGQSEGVDYPEDYAFTLEVDSGSGYVDHTPVSHSIKSGESGTVDVRSYVKTGANRVRIIVTGDSSAQAKTTVWTANLTSLSLTCDHKWERAWIGGESYSINNIYFGGNIKKTLHVLIGDTEYTQVFAASQQYISTAYEFDVSDKFPTDGTGIYAVELWMTADGVETSHIYFNLMCVAAEDVVTAKLTVLNNVMSSAVNFASNDLFEYATYNRTSVTLDMSADLDGTSVVLVDGQEMSVLTQTRNTYTTSLTLDTEETDNLSLTFKLDDQERTIPIDNSNAYLPTSGAYFYLQPALRYNTTEDREEIHNTASGATTTTYAAEWSGMTWSDSDGWTTDDNGSKELTMRAGSTLSITDLKPLATSSASSLSIEFMYSAGTIADYDTPVMTMIDTDSYDESTSRGIVLFPTRLLILTSNERAPVYQRIDLREDEITHVMVILKRNVSATGHNLCSVFVNGTENVTFEYSGTSSFGSGCVKIGQPSTDFRLYMMRLYSKALESSEAFDNFLNAVVESSTWSKSGLRKDNNILDSGSISYDLVKKAGFNCLVYETDDALPSLENQETGSMRVNVRVEYNDHPEWNVTIKNIPIDGQGTTSMRYYRWNLRNKIKDSSTVWEYPNYNGGTTETGKTGYIAGYGLHPSVGTITSKKNVASSPQGHKMGATGLYNDLWMLTEDTSVLPANARVTVYEYPMMTFQMYSDGTYEYRGLMTFGPDKKDKKTFGYGETESYPSLMMIEGPNHAPLMTRFLVPWTDEVAYDYANETLSYGGQEGWDADIAAAYSTDKASDKDSIQSLYETEFKPAYDAIYYASPYIASLAESGKTLDEINADISGFKAGTTRGYSNELMTFYDSEYRLVYYSNAQGMYVTLPTSTHDMLTYLGLSGTPTTEEILEARETKFNSTVWNYVSKSEALFHYVFCEMLAVTDNFAKNSYWRKFASLADGGKWGFNQDDLDTLFANDNNGQDTKLYNVEPQDVNSTDGSEIFQGVTSAFWTAIRLWCTDEIEDKYKDVFDALVELAGTYKVSASTTHQSVINAISHYFHASSSRYFPATSYNGDTKFSYTDVWALAPSAVYNNVPPLTQIHGDHYDTEMNWIERRVDYIMSKYRLGGWTGSGDDGLGKLEFTPANVYKLKVVPALDEYPRMSIGGAASSDSQRVAAGDTYEMELPASSNTTIYIKGVDLLSDVGDLHDLVIASRGGSDEIQLSLGGKRLRRVLCGNDDASAVTFNVTKMTIDGEAIETINLKNCATVKGTLDLTGCTRVREIDLSGTSITSALPPVGGRVTKLVLPASQAVLFLHSLNLLTADSLTLPDLDGIESVYINGMTAIDALQLLFSIMATEENALKYITLLWSGTSTITDAAQLSYFTYLANHIYDTETGEGYGRVDWNGSQLSNVGEKPDLQGKLDIQTSAYRKDINALQTTFPNVDFTMVGDVYQDFEDDEVLEVAVDTWGDGTGVLEDTWQTTAINWSTQPFKGNTEIEEFNEMGDMTVTPTNFGLSTVPSSLDGYGQFSQCTGLTEVTLPNCEFNGCGVFNQCNGLTTVNVKTNTKVTNAAFMFRKCTSLATIPLIDFSEVINAYAAFSGDTALTSIPEGIDFVNVTNAGSMFASCTSLTELPNGFAIPNVTNASSMLDTCTSLTTLPSGFTLPKVTNANSMFSGCTSLTALPSGFTLPNVTTANNMFRGCTSLTTLPSGFALPKVTDAYGMFYNCTSLTTVGDFAISSSAGTNNSNVFRGCTSLTTVGNVYIPNGVALFTECSNLVSVGNLDIHRSSKAEVGTIFYHCSKLQSIGNIICTNCIWTSTSFTNAYALTTIGGMTGLSSSVDLRYSSNLTPLSVHNIINTATGGTSSANITITLHATAKANWQASEYYEEDAAMCTAKYITIA